MASEHPNRIAELRRSAGLTQSDLADKLDVHWVTISKLERGKIQLHTGWMEQIADALGVHPVDLISERPRKRQIQISGVVKEGGQVRHLLKGNTGSEPYEISVPEVAMGADVGEWVIVETDNYWPHYHRGDKLFFVAVVPEQAQIYVGRLVVIEAEGNEDSVIGYLLKVGEGMVADIQVADRKPLHDLPIAALWVLVDVRYAFPHADAKRIGIADTALSD